MPPAVLAEMIEHRRRCGELPPAGLDLAVEDAKRVFLVAAVAVGAQKRQPRGEVGAQRLAVSGTANGVADRIEREGGL